jgi:hypothetical protein
MLGDRAFGNRGCVAWATKYTESPAMRTAACFLSRFDAACLSARIAAARVAAR